MELENVKQIRKSQTSNRSFNTYLLSTYIVPAESWIGRIKAGFLPLRLGTLLGKMGINQANRTCTTANAMK